MTSPVFQRLFKMKLLLSIIGLGLLTSCGQNSSSETGSGYGQITRDRLLNTSNNTGDWLTGGRDYQQSYYSPLDEINADNIGELGFAWEQEIDSEHGFEATPIVVDGTMYSSGPKGATYALDAKTGKSLWIFEPKLDEAVMQRLCCGVVNRGVAVWEGKVYVAALDGVLYSLDAEDGSILWQTDTIADKTRGYSVTGAPYIAGSNVVIGNGGAELDARGYITAYNQKSGEQAWRFYTVPGDPAKGFEHPELEAASKTWDPNSRWDVGLGGTAWDGMAWDPELNLLYVGTGNGSPWVRKIRSPEGGDNLYLSTILAINPDTGKLVWHYQTTPADNWDYTAAQKMILADLDIDGKKRKVLMQAPKNGFFYVLDRATGEMISAKPYVPMNWASGIDPKTGKPIETGQGEYFDEPKLVMPGSAGGHNWQPMSFNPDTGLVYIPAFHLPMIFNVTDKNFKYQRGGANFGATVIFPMAGPFGLDGEAAKALPPIATLAKGQPDYTPRGMLIAWDPVGQKKVWEVDTSGDWKGHFFSSWNGGGLMSSAGGLLFQGRATGELIVMNAKTGKQLAALNVGTSIMAAPMTYMVDGEQYVAVMAGLGGAFGTVYLPGTAAHKYGNKGRIIVFKLGGGKIPARTEVAQKADAGAPPLERRGSKAEITLGSNLFQRHCAICHAGAGGAVPSLTEMNAATHAEFMDIVLKGTRAEKGMGSFREQLSDSDAMAIETYLIDVAWQDYERKNKPHSGAEK